VALAKLRERRPAAPLIALVLAGFITGALLPTRLHWSEPRPFAHTMSRLFSLRSGSGALRVRQYGETDAIMRSHWWSGIGLDGWGRAMRAHDPELAVNCVPHSDYLRVLADGGVPAEAGLLLWLGGTMWLAWRRQRRLAGMLALVSALAVIS